LPQSASSLTLNLNLRVMVHCSDGKTMVHSVVKQRPTRIKNS